MTKPYDIAHGPSKTVWHGGVAGSVRQTFVMNIQRYLKSAMEDKMFVLHAVVMAVMLVVSIDATAAKSGNAFSVPRL